MALELMIDLETLGTEPGAAVISIGAVKWDWQSLEVVDTFYRPIDPENAKKYGSTSQSVLDWWAKQSGPARQHAMSGTDSSFTVAEHFAEFARGCRPWGNGSVFDVVISESLFRAHGIKSPWLFWNIRDLRTLLDVAKDLAGFDKKSVPFVGIEHHALHDALHEAKLAAEALRAMRGREEMPLNMVVSVD